MASLEPELRQGLLDLTLTLGDAQVTQLLDYLALLQKWTGVYNLTAVRDPAEMLTHHLLDCLAVIAPLRAHMAGARQNQAPESGQSSPGNRLPLRLLDVLLVHAVEPQPVKVDVEVERAAGEGSGQHARVQVNF